MGDFFNGLQKTFNFLTSPFAALGGLIEAKMPGSGYEDKDMDYWDYVDLHRGDYGDAASSASTVESLGNNSSSDDSSLDITGTDQALWEFEKQQQLLAEQRAFNSAEAQKNRDWQERMSNTAYQRATADLEAAGLNKWLSVTGGGNGASASTPSGSSATSQAGDASAPNPKLAQALLQFGQNIVGSIIKAIAS